MYLDRHDIVQLKETLEQMAVFEEDLYLIYRRADNGEIGIASGDEEIMYWKEGKE